MPTIAQQCAEEALSPILRKSISGIRKALGMQRNTAKIIESERPDLKVLTEVVDPLIQADRLAGNYSAKAGRELNAIFRRSSIGDTEGILAHALNTEAAASVFPSPKHAEVGAKFADWIKKQLAEQFGMSPEQAQRFLHEDLVALRQHRGDMPRLDPNNIYPETFQPLMEELRNGSLSATQSNGYVFGRQLASAIARTKFIQPEAQRVRKLIFSDWQKLKLPKDDLLVAQDFANGFLDGRLSQRDQIVTQSTKLLRDFINNLGDAWKIGGLTRKATDKFLDDDTLIRMAHNAATWYGGYAMGFNPAMVFRDLLGGTVMPALKVGPRAASRGIRDVWSMTPEGDALRARWAADLGLAEKLGDLHQPLPLEVGQESIFAGRVSRELDKLREFGLLPRRYSDKMSRIAAARQGEVAVEMHAPALLSGKLSWNEFMYETGLKGSSLAEQEQIRQILVNREVPNVAEAARKYGLMVERDSNFVYAPSNAPAAFRGTVGRLFGQFGIWPVSFAEYMLENTVGSRDAKWAYRFMSRYAGLTVALAGLSAATGVDTSTWMFSNPLTFQGGPWFQAFRDVTTLGTSTNEFERREASANVRKMFGNSTTGFMGGVINPFGGATTNLFQALNETSPVDAMLLGLGFNLERPSLATRR